MITKKRSLFARPLRLALSTVGTFLIAGFATASATDNYSYGSRGYSYGSGYGYGDDSLIRCSSEKFRRTTCRAYGRIRDARIYDRLSDARCRKGRDWGYSDNYIWVDNGCRAIFKVDIRGNRGGYGYDRGRDRDYGYGRDRDYGYGRDRDYGYGYGISRDIAIGNCIARAERQLYRDGFRRARFDRIERSSQFDRGWRLNLIFRVRHDNHYHYPVFGCDASRRDTRLTRYDFGQQGRQCGFNFRLSGY